MTLHNYRSWQVHETLNGVNLSSGFRRIRSAKSGPNLWQNWHVFGPWASTYWANGQITMTVHNYRRRQFHRTSNGEHSSSGYRDMGSASLAAPRPDHDDNTPPVRRAEGLKVNGPCYWPLVWGIHSWRVNSSHNGPLIRTYVRSLDGLARNVW